MIAPITIEAYLVIFWIFFLPSSPSLDNCSNLGIATVKSCIMIEALMYGTTPKANILNLLKEPPEIKS